MGWVCCALDSNVVCLFVWLLLRLDVNLIITARGTPQFTGRWPALVCSSVCYVTCMRVCACLRLCL